MRDFTRAPLIDDLKSNMVEQPDGSWAISRPMEGFGLLKWKIRISHALQVVFGRAQAIRYKE